MVQASLRSLHRFDCDDLSSGDGAKAFDTDDDLALAGEVYGSPLS